jgi:hypothetical protein
MAVKIEKTRPVRYQPHVIVEKPNPFDGSISSTWKAILGGLILLETDLLGVGFLTLNKDILFKLWVFNAASFVCIIAIIVLPILWLWLAGNQKRLDNTIEKMAYNKRLKKGIECLSIFDPKVTDSIIRSITGIIGYDPESGLFRSLVNEIKTGLRYHLYRGNWFASYILTIDFAETDDILLIENMYSILKKVPQKHYMNTVMLTTDTFANAMKEYEEMLKETNLPKNREQALYGILEQYAGNTSLKKQLYILHVGLPFTVSRKTAAENLVKIENSLIQALEGKKIHAEQIKEPILLAAIIKGALTGKIHMVKGI